MLRTLFDKLRQRWFTMERDSRRVTVAALVVLPMAGAAAIDGDYPVSRWGYSDIFMVCVLVYYLACAVTRVFGPFFNVKSDNE